MKQKTVVDINANKMKNMHCRQKRKEELNSTSISTQTQVILPKTLKNILQQFDGDNKKKNTQRNTWTYVSSI